MPLCPICKEDKYDDSFLLFYIKEKTIDYVCESCIRNIRTASYYIINSRFQIKCRSIGEYYRTSNFNICISSPSLSGKNSGDNRPENIPAIIDITKDFSRGPKSSIKKIGRYTGFILTSLNQKCDKYSVNLKFEEQLIEDFEIVATKEVTALLLGWDFVLACLMPGIIGGLVDWRRSEQHDMLLVGPLMTMLTGISQTYSNLFFARKSSVLLLGQDTTKLPILRRIQHYLYKKGYDAILVKDLPDIEEHFVETKVELLGAMCKYIICENSTVSGHIDELKICQINRYIIAILRKDGEGATWMQSDYGIDNLFIKEFVYKEYPEEVLDKASQWAERMLLKRRKSLEKCYPWRK